MEFASRKWTLPAAAALWAVVLGLRVLFPDPNSGISALWLLPVVLVAVEYGVRAGVAAGVISIALSAIGADLAGTSLPLLSYLPRSAGFILVGALAGATADALHRTADAVEAGSRHFELSEDLLFTVGFGGRITNVNDSWMRVMGWSREELIHSDYTEWIHPDDRDRTLREVLAAAVNDESGHISNRYFTKSGECRNIEWTTRADFDHLVIYAVGRDVTERYLADEQNREAEERFRRVFDDSSAGMALVGMDGLVVEANESLARILACKREDLIGVNTVTEFSDRGDLPIIREGLQSVIEGRSRTFEREVRIRRYDDRSAWVQLTVSLIRDAAGNPLYRMSQVIDIDARKRAEDKLRRLADYDELSGVLNRRRFEEELDKEYSHAAQANRMSAVLLLDVDDFKGINDTMGHAAGDRVISEMGRHLEGRLRTGDVIARLGGDEFAILLRRTRPVDAESVARGIQETVARDLGLAAGVGRNIHVSVGVAMVQGGSALKPDSVLDLADHAMYEAKGLGGDRVVSRSVEIPIVT